MEFAPRHAPQVAARGFWLGKVLAGQKPKLLLRFVGTFSALEAPDVLLRQPSVRGKDPVAEEANAALDYEDHTLPGMQRQSQPNQKLLDLLARVGQEAIVVGEYQQIIDITDVAPDPQAVLDEAVERVEVEVGEELPGLAADGNAAPPVARREKVVAGEVVHGFILRIAVVDNLTNQPQHVLVLDRSSRPVRAWWTTRFRYGAALNQSLLGSALIHPVAEFARTQPRRPDLPRR